MNRVEILEEIADRYQELVDPMNGPSGIAGDGDSVVMMPPTYTPTVKEFERLVKRLTAEAEAYRSTGQGLHDAGWWLRNLRSWFLDAPRRTLYECPKCLSKTHHATHQHRAQSGLMSAYDGRRVLAVMRTGERRAAVRALEWIAEQWGLANEPMLPREIAGPLGKSMFAEPKAAAA